MKHEDNPPHIIGTVHKERKSGKKLALSIGSTIIFVLAVVSFIFLPGVLRSAVRQAKPFGYYYGTPITYEQGSLLAQNVNYMQQLAQLQGQSANQYVIFYNAYNQTVQQMAASRQVRKSGYTIPRSDISREMALYFVDENGNYSARLFNETPESRKLEIQKGLTDSLTLRRYSEDLLGAQENGALPTYGLKTSSKELPFIHEMADKNRAFKMASFSFSDYPLDQAAVFGREHADLFTKYDLSVLSFDTEAQAKNVIRQLEANEVVFEDAVSSLSTKYYGDSEGKLTNSYRYQLREMLSSEDSLEAVAALTPQSFSAPIAAANGFVVFRCDGEPVQADMENADMQQVAYDYMKIYESGQIEQYFTDRARDFSAAAIRSGFDAAGEQFGAKITDIPAFPLNYGSVSLYSSVPSSEPELSGASSNENVLRTLFSLRENELTDPLVLSGAVAVFQLTEETGATDLSRALIDSSYQMSKMQFDAVAMQNAIMNDDNFTDHFFEVFFSEFMNRN